MGNSKKVSTTNWATNIISKLPPEDVGNVIVELINSKKELEITCEQETTKRIKIHNQLEISLKNIDLKREIISTALNKEYGLRQENIEKMFDLVEKALDSEKDEIVIAAIDGIVNIVKESPLNGIAQIASAFENDEEELII